MSRLIQKLSIIVSLGLLPLIVARGPYAAPGELASSPLTTSTAVEPNIHLTLDDSGSMKLQMMITPDLLSRVPTLNGQSRVLVSIDADEGIPIVDRKERHVWHPRDAADPALIMPDASLQSNEIWNNHFWVLRTHEVNKLYYNPAVTYEPWPGLDANGTPMYRDANPAAVLLDPNQPATAANTFDLTDENFTYASTDGCPFIIEFFRGTCTQSLFLPVFYTSTDSNNNGIVDSSDTHTLVEIKPATNAALFPSGSYQAEIQNFANWFQYYRSRESAAKAALGNIVFNANFVRMGLDLLNQGHRNHLESMTDENRKIALLRSIYGVDSSGFTPARSALIEVGEMFRQSTTVDGIPAPILPANEGGECQQNFNILMTDGLWTEESDITVGNADANSDIGHATDINIGGGITKGFDGDATQSIDGGNYADAWSNTLADVAMHYYETDLRDLANKVPTTPGIDQAPHQHLVTYTVAFGVQGTLDPLNDSPTSDGFVWPDPFANPSAKIDDLWHAAYNSRGSFLSAQNPTELIDALSVAIDDIADRTATSSAVSVTSARLTTDSVVYRSLYNTNRWTGTISALPIVDLQLGIISDQELWDAASVLDQPSVTADNRTVLTLHKTADLMSPRDGVPFRWANITDAMKADLRINPAGISDSDAVAEARLDFLRGDRTNEGTGFGFRVRDSRLGDIVNSGPVFVKEANLGWPDEAPFPTGDNAYSTFRQSIGVDDPDTPNNEAREGVIYVGANDGMLHGFRESDGREILAYVPSNLFSSVRGEGLHYLTHPNYLHKYYNDLTPTISDVYIAHNNATQWRTVLIAGQRGGGRGYSALDITNPASFSEDNASATVMWEFSETDDDNLGYTFSQPQVGMTNDGEWVAVFGNGYNHSGADGDAKLFIVKIAEGLDGEWSASDYTVISTGAGSAADRNGLGTPALADIDGNGTIDRAYAGDLQGNLWAFDLESPLPSTWVQASSVSRLFTTIGSRPITSQPALSFHPTVGTTDTNSPNIMVAFGSGQLLVKNDLVATNNEYFYGVWDRGEANLTATNLVAQVSSTTSVQALVDPLNPDAGTTTVEARTLTRSNVDYNTSRGWYINLPASGERMVTNPIIRSNVVFFNTLIPATDICAGSGSGFRFSVDLAFGGPPSEPVIDINQDGVVDDNDRLGDELHSVVAAVRYDRALTDDTITERHLINQSELIAIKTAPDRKTGRISWQELLQE